MGSSRRVAIVTGSGRGIGRSIALSLAKTGARVVVNVRKNVDEGQQTLESIKKLGSECVLSKADVSTDAGAKALIDEAISSFGGVDLLVNNAGIGIAIPLLETGEELWNRQIDTSLKSAFLCSKYALKPMLENRWGRIVNISSVAGVIGLANLAAYSAAKAGLLGLTRALAAEVSPDGVTVNAIAAGLVNTKMGMSLVDVIASKSQRTENAEKLSAAWSSKHTLTGKMLDANEIANVVTFLASDEAANITGQVITVDGGWSIVEARNYFSLK